MLAALADENAAIGALDDRDDHGNHEAPRGCARHFERIFASSWAPRTRIGAGVLSSSSRTTKTRRFLTAETSPHFSFAYAFAGLALSPVAAQARMIASGLAAATSSSVTRAPRVPTNSALQIWQSSATQGGELIRGFGQASQ